MKGESYSLLTAFVFLGLFFSTIVIFSFCPPQVIDISINDYFSKLSAGLLTDFFIILSFIFEPLYLIILSFAIFLFFYFKGFKKDSLFFLANPVLAGILVFIFKEIIQRQRPENLLESGFGFPSGHATIAFALFLSITYLSLKKMKKENRKVIPVLSAFLILLVSFGRIYLGVHWFSDVLAGAFLGCFVFFFNLYFFEKLK